MTSTTIIYLFTALLLIVGCSTHQCQGFSVNSPSPTRREVFNSVMAAASILTPPLTASAASKDATSFVGRYSDPINHPGGTREIKLIDG